MVCTQNQRLYKQLEEYLRRCFQNWACHAQDEWRKLSPATSVGSVQIEIKSVRCQEQPGILITDGSQDLEKGWQQGFKRSTRMVEFMPAINIHPSATVALLQLDPSALLRCVDLMLGGYDEPSNASGNETVSSEDVQWTSVEDRIVDWLLMPWCKQLANILASPSVSIRTAIPESVVALHERYPSSVDYFVVDFEVTLREATGQSHVVSGKWSMSSQSLAPYLEAVFGGERTVRQQHELVAVMARSTLTEEDIRQMEVGDVIATEVDANGSFSLELYGTPLFSIEPGVVHGRKAIRIVQH